MFVSCGVEGLGRRPYPSGVKGQHVGELIENSLAFSPQIYYKHIMLMFPYSTECRSHVYIVSFDTFSCFKYLLLVQVQKSLDMSSTV